VGLISIKITGEHYQQIKAIGEKAGLSIRAVAERVIAEGLNATEQVGKVVVNNPDALAKVRKSLAQMRESEVGIMERLDGIEDETLEDGEVTQGKKFEVKAPVPVVRKEDDGEFEYHCAECGSPLVSEPEEDRLENCRDCGARLDWAHPENTEKGSEGFGAGKAILVGFLALLAVSSLGNRAGTY